MKMMCVFFDDILIYSSNVSAHHDHLKQVLFVLVDNCFVANRTKCQFGCPQVEYLGHVISGQDVAVDHGKVQCILDWLVPKNVRGVCGFLGLTGYYPWSELPELFDWRDYSGVLSRTRDQGRCACCWAFSVTHAIQSALKFNRGVSVLLSKQELLDCVYHEKDEGGWLDLSYAYIYRYGSALEKYYRYDDAYDLPCETVSRRVYIDGFARCDSSEESLMKTVLNQPISVSLCAGIELMDGYQKGDIFDAPRCHIFDEEGKLKAIDNDDINHSALLVGYGSNDGNDYWILQNSWGKAWGDKGFFFLKRNNGSRFGQCNIAMNAWYPIIHRSGKIRSGGRPYFRGLGGEIEENNGGESFKREMRDSEELLSKLNPLAEEYVPSSLTNNEGYLAAGLGYPNNLMLLNNYANANGQTNQRWCVLQRKNDYTTNGKQSVNHKVDMEKREEMNRRTVYVFDIDQLVTEEQLASLFLSCGQVVDCRVCGDPNSILRFALIEFTDEESARAAVSLSGTMLGYYPLRVLPSKTAIEPVNPTFLPRSEDEREMCSRTIYCTNIDKKLTQADVKHLFESICGEVQRLRLLGDYQHSTRIAFVEFTVAESAIAALSCSGVILGVLPIRVRLSKTPV